MPYGESDKIIRLYTERAGKLSVLVKGAKSRRSATVALSETFTFGLYRLGAGNGVGIGFYPRGAHVEGVRSGYAA